MKKTILLTIFFIDVFSLVIAQQTTYHRAKIYTGTNGLIRLGALGLCVDHGQIKKDTWIISDFSDEELNKAKQAGFTYDILIEDVSNYYQRQNNNSNKNQTLTIQNGPCNSITNFFPYTIPSHFRLGSMGGFYTYNELLQILDSMALLYPQLISVKAPISNSLTTVEGRDIFYVRITSNTKPDNQKAKVLYNALHHAREACSITQLIYYMWYLLENYGSDSRVTSIVDNLQLYFIPVVNPDGYLYNQQTNPNGGGMWRKNRAINGNNTYGVDLNRNYGYYWGYDNNGSSPDPSSDTYRGPSAFSEPETKMMRDFINAQNFAMSINYHTYSNVLIFPWGYINALCPDSNLFIAQCEYMSRENGFGYGNPYQTVGYVGNGVADDWLYDDPSHTKIYTITPEAGEPSDGFWPAINRIIPICQNTFIQNIKFAELALDLIEFKNKNERYLPNLCNFIKFSVKRLGLQSGSLNSVSFTPVSATIQSIDSLHNYSNLQLLDEVLDSINICLTPGISTGDEVIVVINTHYANYTQKDTLRFIYGMPTAIFSNNGNSLNGFTSSVSGTWGITNQQYVSAPNSITDSPLGNYTNNITTTLTSNGTFNLADVQEASLSFYAKWDIESGYDYVEVQASTNNGSTWSNLCGKYTHAGSMDQNPGEPLYDGKQTTWVKEEINLNHLIGQTIKIRFRLKSDAFVTADGFYVDDIVLSVISNATAINKPLALLNSSIYIDEANYQLVIQAPENLNFQLFNTMGELVNSGITQGKETRINTTNLPVGIYFVRLTNVQETVFGEKVIITH